MNIHEKICKEIMDRREMGIKKYGTTVEEAGLTPKEWLKHSVEEKMDDLVYSMMLLESMEEGE